MQIIHPYYDLVEDPNGLDAHPVEAVTVNAALETGINAQVVMMGRPKNLLIDVPIFGGPGLTTDLRPRPVLFYVTIRELQPGPRLGPRDEQVMMWIQARGWAAAVDAAERRWLELYQTGELEQLAARVNDARAVEADRRRVEDATAPGFFDEVYNEAGDKLQALYEALQAIGGKLVTVAKIGLGIWLGFKAIELIRK